MKFVTHWRRPHSRAESI